MTAADDRVAKAFPHADFCHVGGCPSLGFCYSVGEAITAWRREQGRLRADEVEWLEKNGDCGSRECDCITGDIQRFVQEERALVLEQVADAAYTSPANKPPRVVRVMHQSASLIREGLA